MGFVIEVSAYRGLERTYFVQELDISEAKRKAYDMFRKSSSCYLPETLAEAEVSDLVFVIEVCKVEQIIL